MGFWAERPQGIDFSKNVEISNIQNPENPKNCRKVVRNGSGKVLPGSRQVRMRQNCVPNPMECLPEPKTPVKNSKHPKICENPENPGFSYFPIGSL